MFSPAFKRWAVPLYICLAAISDIGAKEPVIHSPAARTGPVQLDAKALQSSSAAPVQVLPQKIDEEIDSLENPVDSETIMEQQNNPDPEESPFGENFSAAKPPDRTWETREYQSGVIDGKRNAKGKPLWVLGGLAGSGLCIFFGVAGIGLAVAVPYYPFGEDLLGKSSSYIEGYIAGFKSSTRWKNAGWATLGFAVAIGIDLALGIPIIFGDFHIDEPLQIK